MAQSSSCSAVPISIKAKRDIRAYLENPKPFRLLSGWAAQYHDDVSGERQTLGIMLPGDVWCGTSNYGIVALTDCLVAEPGTAFFGDPDGRQSAGVDDLAAVQSWLIALGTLDASGRVARCLLNIFARLDRLGLVERHSAIIPLSQADIASVCCVTPVHVNRCLRSFDKAGLLRREGKRFTLLRETELAAKARVSLR